MIDYNVEFSVYKVGSADKIDMTKVMIVIDLMIVKMMITKLNTKQYYRPKH